MRRYVKRRKMRCGENGPSSGNFKSPLPGDGRLLPESVVRGQLTNLLHRDHNEKKNILEGTERFGGCERKRENSHLDSAEKTIDRRKENFSPLYEYFSEKNQPNKLAAYAKEGRFRTVVGASRELIRRGFYIEGFVEITKLKKRISAN